MLWIAYNSDLPHPRAVLDVLQDHLGITGERVADRYGWSPREAFREPEDGGAWPRDFAFQPTDDNIQPPHHHEDCDCYECCPDEDYDDDYGSAAFVEEEDGPDSWPGLPQIPDSPPGRCRFGIEIEFNQGNRGGIVRGMLSSGLAAVDVSYTHDVVRYWKLTTDSTVSGGELVSPIMDGSDASIEEVKEAIRIVKANGGRPSDRNHPQGMHVHVDVSSFRTPHLAALAHNMERGQQFLAAYVPPSRLTNYNRLISPREWQALHHWLQNVDISGERSGRRSGEGCPVDRGVDFNFNSLLSYGTVECRLLGSTLNTLRVSTWIRVLQTFVEASRNCAEMPDGEILDWLAGFGLESEHIDRFRSVVTERGNQARLIAA